MDDLLKNEYLKAQNFFAHGDIRNSKKILCNLLEKYDDVADLYNFLGVIYNAEKNFQASKNSFEKALKLRPDFSIAMACYAQLLIDFGYFHEAIKHLKKAINKNSLIPEFYINLGLAYIELKNFNDAKLIGERAEKKFKDFPPILNLLGISNFNLNKLIEARGYLLKAIEILPNYAEAHLNLGSTYLELNDFHNAEFHINQSLQFDKNNPLTYKLLANYHSSIELNVNKAVEVINEGLKVSNLEEGNNLLLDDLYEYLSNLGKNNEAQKIAEMLLKSNKEDTFFKIFHNLSKKKYFKSVDCDVVKNAKKIIKDTKNPLNLSYFYFSIANIFSINKNIKSYVVNLKKGNKYLEEYYEKKRSNSEQSYSNLTKSILNSNLDLKKIKIPETKEFHPIFIVGMPRSGSTLLEHILSSHSLIDSVGEIDFFNKFNIKDSYLGFIKGKNNKNLVKFIKSFQQAYIDRIRKTNSRINFFIDKTLSNYLYIDLILCAFPKAKFIHIVREKQSNAWSIYKNPFNYGFYDWTTSLSKIYKIYDEYLNFINVKFVNKSKQFIHISYEDLVFDNKNSVKKLLDFIGLDFEKSCLEHYKNKKAVKTMSEDQVRKKIYSDSIKEWEKFKNFFPEFR